MPGKLKLKVHAARNLPIMDRSSESTDAFVEVHMNCRRFVFTILADVNNVLWLSTFALFYRRIRFSTQHFICKVFKFF